MGDRYEWVESNFGDLASGDSTTGRAAGVCYCGKAPSSCSLGVRRDGRRLLFNCFSGNCDLKGGAVLAGSAVGGDKHARDGGAYAGAAAGVALANPELPSGFVRCLPGDAAEWLDGVGVGAAAQAVADVGYAGGRVVFPLFEPKQRAGRIVGWAGRLVGRGTGPKWLYNKGLEASYVYFAGKIVSEEHPGGAAVHHPAAATTEAAAGKRLVLVEDIPSALRLSYHCDAVAILGTELTEGKLQSVLDIIADGAYSTVYIALDADAFKKALQASLKLGRRGVKTKIIQSDQDPKYWSDEEVKEKLT
jgi:hypothetical protein